MARQENINAKVPVLTLLIVGVSIIAYRFPQFSDLIVYDRRAILGGQAWRLMTAPLVHFSASHLFWDVVVFGVAGGAIEAAGQRGFRLMLSLAACIPSLMFLLALPEIERFGGLSGLATGAVAYLCLCQMARARRGRLAWIVMLALIGIKIMAEIAVAAPLFAQADGVAFRSLPCVHVLGYLAALAAAARGRPGRRYSRRPSKADAFQTG
jgi:rhomboid family GlyGly-CTERM serine protease